MKSKGNWKKVLLYLYSAPDGSEPSVIGDDFKHAVAYLQKHELIEGDWDKKGYSLTRKGFEVALEVEKHEENFRIQLAIILFTGALFLTALFDFLQKVWPISPWVLWSSYLICLLLLLVAWNWQMNKTQY